MDENARVWNDEIRTNESPAYNDWGTDESAGVVSTESDVPPPQPPVRAALPLPSRRVPTERERVLAAQRAFRMSLIEEPESSEDSEGNPRIESNDSEP